MRGTGDTAGGTAKQTARIPSAPLRLLAPAPPVCAWCGLRLNAPRVNQRFCSRSCRVADNALKWATAPDAVLAGLTAMLLHRELARIPTRAQLQDALDYAGARRWARMMRRVFGLKWEDKQWVTD